VIRRVRLLPAGRCLVDRSLLKSDEPPGELVDTPIWMILVEATDALVLVDTGMPDTCVGNPGYFDGTEDAGRIRPQMTAADTVERVLARAGYRPADVDAVVSTHLHFDHAGGNRCFRTTPILIHPLELEAARAGSYVPECREPDLAYRPVADGESPLEGVTLLHTPGHTPGHLSVLVEAPTGPLLFTVDAVYTAANWATGVPGAGRDAGAMRRSVARLRAVERATGARVFFGHDREQASDPAWRALVG
jgi:N-acyl homoserine lactone hydrolase